MSYNSTDSRLYQPLYKTSARYYLFLIILLLLTLSGGVAYAYQLYYGLEVTGLNRPVFWGIYMINFVYFLGISYGALIIIAIFKISGFTWRRPLTRIAEVIALVTLIIGGPQVMLDLGRVDRSFLLFVDGQLQSPIMWDVYSLIIYFFVALTYLYLPLIPDLAQMRDNEKLGSLRRLICRLFALGWKGTEKQKRLLYRSIDGMAFLIIPIGLVHTVPWIFSATIQPMWHSPLMGPYFLLGSLYTGLATIIIVAAWIRKGFGLEEYIQVSHFKKMGLLMAALALTWSYFTFNEYLTTYYGADPHHMEIFHAQLYGQYAPIFWTMVATCFVIPFLLMSLKRFRTITTCVLAAVSVNFGMWLERYIIIVPTLTKPRVSYGPAHYNPTWIEWSLTLSSFAGAIFLFALAVKFFPIVSPAGLKRQDEENLALLDRLKKRYEEGEEKESGEEKGTSGKGEIEGEDSQKPGEIEGTESESGEEAPGGEEEAEERKGKEEESKEEDKKETE